MKTMPQRLQSRISLRRNVIAEMEFDADFYKRIGFNFVTRNIRNAIKPLAEDQKLDKDMFNYMTGMQQIFGQMVR